MLLHPWSDSSSTNRYVALKILTADSYGGEKDTFELDILKHIKVTNPSHPGAKHILGLLDHFRHRGPYGDHVCLVFQAVGPDFATFRRQLPELRLPMVLVSQVSKQLLL